MLLFMLFYKTRGLETTFGARVYVALYQALETFGGILLFGYFIKSSN